MDLTHLHLHVRDRAAAVAFYEQWFGLRVSIRGDEITFLKGDRGFLLALMQDPAPAPMPPWFHFGIRMETAKSVRDMMAAMEAAGIPIVKVLYEDDKFASFRCADGDGYCIEIYWQGE